MRNMINFAMTCFVAIALIAAPSSIAQTRSGGSSRSSSSSSSSHSSASSSRGGSYSSGRSSMSTSSSRGGGYSSSSSSRSSASVSRSSAPQRSSSSSSVSRNSAPQTRSNSSVSRNSAPQTRSNSSVSRNSSSSQSRSGVSSSAPQTRSNSSVSRSSAPQTRSNSSAATRAGSSQSRSSSAVTRSGSSTGRSATPLRQGSGSPSTRAGSSPARSAAGLSPAPNASRTTRQGAQPGNVVTREGGRDFTRIDTKRDVVRIPPRHREPVHYDIIPHFWAPHSHYFGHRIHVLPVGYHHIHHWGIDYYCYNDIYYRMYGGYYYVCRPPFGTFLDIVDDIAFSAVRFSYYNNLYRTYNRIDDNYATIDEQNRIIAQNNATIASQNEQIALNSTRATASYTLANGLGLFQSYANAGQQYFYNDGVFYIMNANNQYEVIVPPAGALVDELPDDYDRITINGAEYYLVDTTVYRMTIIDGSAKLEVLGQMSDADAQRYHDQANASENAAW